MSIPQTPQGRIEANLAALETLRAVENANRPANLAERRTLVRWTSWGAASGIFDDTRDDFAGAAARLRALIGPEEWKQAQRTVLNAHYTDTEIVTAMWEHLKALGFEGGAVLEPGSGAGVFIAHAPETVSMTGVELDPTTARIARLLNPAATIRTESFADTSLSEGEFDATIGNVPFSSAKLHDPVHNAAGHSMHNHFILKSLALTKPGGVVAVITSSFTLDAQNPAARREIAAHADFLGAVRLPTGAHRRAAGTDALTDVLVLRRRVSDEAWHAGRFELTQPIELPREGDSDDLAPVEARVNEYFIEHPEMVLGEFTIGHGMYHGEALRVSPRGNTVDALRAALATIAERARRAGITHAPRPIHVSERRAAARIGGSAGEFPGHIRSNGLEFDVLTSYGTYESVKVPGTQASELRALLALRDLTASLLTAEAQSVDDTDEIRELRDLLNRRYDSYHDRFGAINRCSWHPTGRVDEAGEPVMSVRRPPVMRVFRADPHSPAVMALEEYDATTDSASKTAIMRGRVVAPRAPRLGADNPSDALAICIDTHGRVDLEEIATLLGVDDAEARTQLRGLVYADPAEGGKLVTAAAYLSGDVRAKLSAAESAADEDPETYGENVEPLRAVIPEDLGPAEIDARLGAAWIDADDIETFLREVLRDNSITVERGPGSEWKVTGGNRGVASIEEFGTERVPAPRIAQALLRQSAIRVYDPDENGDARIFNPAATEAANEKAEQLNERFSEWVWENPARAQRLSAEYNRRFNCLVVRRYDTTAMSLPGLSRTYSPRPHQLAAVARMIAEPNVGLFHAVGAGKTLEMAMGVMELKRLGLVRKPAIVVPNHMLDQFAREFLQAYPQARLLAAGSEDLAGEKRRAFVARATTGDWDAVVMTRGSFQRLEMSQETEHWYFDREIEPRRQYLQHMRKSGAGHQTVKRVEQAILMAEEKLKKRLNQPVDPGITFEQTGIDYVVIDELHDYKNLATDTNIPGAAIAGSQRAQDLHMKIEYLRHKYNGRAVTGATATPIANSITEAYVMQRYLRPDLMIDAGIENFDQWAATFGKTKTELEMSVDGNSWSLKTRFSGFRNVQELQRLFHVAADIKLPEDLGLPVPKLAARTDGERAPHVLAVPPTSAQLDYVQQLGQRADLVRSKAVDPSVDNMLKISSDGRAAALDLRLVKDIDADELDPSEYGLKVAASADWLYRQWETNKDRVYLDKASGQPHTRRGALHIVFCDLGTPGEGWNVYDELKTQLVGRGVPSEQIAFIHEAKTDRAKASLFAKARNGSVQVLIGSTSKMGVGTNIQDRAASMLHIDCPWRPADIEQRDGRGVRQGNQNGEIAVARVVTEGTFDARMWSAQARKASFINQFMKGSLTAREVDDIGDAALNANEAVAIASGNPLVLEKAEVDAEVTKLDRLRRGHQRSQSALHVRIRAAEHRIPQLETEIANLEAAIARRKPTRGDAFGMTVAGRWYTSRPEAGDALAHTLYKLIAPSDARWREYANADLGVIGGFRMHGMNVPTGKNVSAEITWPEIPGLALSMGRDALEKGGTGLALRIENAIDGLDHRLATTRRKLAVERDELSAAQARLGRPFEHADRLDMLRERKKVIDTELRGDDEKDDGNEIENNPAPKPTPPPLPHARVADADRPNSQRSSR